MSDSSDHYEGPWFRGKKWGFGRFLFEPFLSWCNLHTVLLQAKSALSLLEVFGVLQQCVPEKNQAAVLSSQDVPVILLLPTLALKLGVQKGGGGRRGSSAEGMPRAFPPVTLHATVGSHLCQPNECCHPATRLSKSQIETEAAWPLLVGHLPARNCQVLKLSSS